MFSNQVALPVSGMRGSVKVTNVQLLKYNIVYNLCTCACIVVASLIETDKTLVHVHVNYGELQLHDYFRLMSMGECKVHKHM